MFENLFEDLQESTSKDILLDVVTDELGNKVHIIQQSIWNKSGKLTDRCVMAVYPNGTLYPEYADKTVLAACHAAAKAINERRTSSMTDKQIYSAYGETANYSDPDAYASDVVLSLMDAQDMEENERRDDLGLDPITPDSAQEPDMELFYQLRALWHVANDPFKDLLKRMGLSQTECATRFCIPLRTVQGWAGETRQAPLYLRLMMAEATGAVDLHREVP